MVYEVSEKVKLKTGEVISCSIKESDIDKNQFISDLADYVYQVTKNSKE